MISTGSSNWLINIGSLCCGNGQRLPSIRKKRGIRKCKTPGQKRNIFVTASGELYVIDWDSLKLASKECDLMYIGGNIGGDKADPYEISGFYNGYLSSDIDPVLIAYYRFERIAGDIAEFCKQVWGPSGITTEKCEKITGWLESNFNPGCEYETACQSDSN